MVVGLYVYLYCLYCQISVYREVVYINILKVYQHTIYFFTYRGYEYYWKTLFI